MRAVKKDPLEREGQYTNAGRGDGVRVPRRQELWGVSLQWKEGLLSY